MPIIPATQEAKIRGLWTKVDYRQKVRSYLRNNYSKKGWGISQAAEPLPDITRPHVQTPVLPKNKNK
jgi:hypothetical protein